MKLGLISDTHGYLHPRIHDLFSDVDEILHAGDIDSDDVLIELQAIAPVTAVRGNMDMRGRVAAHHQDVLYINPGSASKGRQGS